MIDENKKEDRIEKVKSIAISVLILIGAIATVLCIFGRAILALWTFIMIYCTYS